MLKKIITNIALATLLLAPLGGIALASSINVGNSAIDRANLDSFSNFTVIDTNNPVSASGSLSTFNYYAKNTNSFEFVFVDGANMVKWISPSITPSAGVGAKIWTPTSSVPVQIGWNLGVHFDSTGTIPFGSTGSVAKFTANGSGILTVGSTLTLAGTSDRTYSWSATGDTVFNNNHSTNKSECKKGGWKSFSNPKFRNQGQCVRWSNHQNHRNHHSQDQDENNHGQDQDQDQD